MVMKECYEKSRVFWKSVYFFFFLSTVIKDDRRATIRGLIENEATKKGGIARHEEQRVFNHVVEQQHLGYELLTINCPCSRYKIKDNSMSGFRFSYRTYRFNAKWDSSRSRIMEGDGTSLYYRINLPWYTRICIYTRYTRGDVRRERFWSFVKFNLYHVNSI